MNNAIPMKLNDTEPAVEIELQPNPISSVFFHVPVALEKQWKAPDDTEAPPHSAKIGRLDTPDGQELGDAAPTDIEPYKRRNSMQAKKSEVRARLAGKREKVKSKSAQEEEV